MKAEARELDASWQTKVDLRAQAVYRRTEQVLPWGNVAEATRAEYHRRALADMWLDGSLDLGADVDDDNRFAELLVLDREAEEVIRCAHRRE